jgi:zinc D-Ala-D-Ala carboxypeptidase
MLQFVLNKVDNAGIAQDGIYGKETTDAVRRFQAANGLKADGNSGPATMEKLLEKL